MHDTETLEPAIPPHLREVRTCPLGAAADFVPLHASYSARFRPEISGISIGYFGVQWVGNEVQAKLVLEHIRAELGRADGPNYWDVAAYRDSQGFQNRVVAAYWNDDAANRRWEESLGPDWWYRGLEVSGKIGTFRELYRASVRDAETTFTHPYAEGCAKVAAAMSGKTDTHEYWGSSRDRIPRAQTDLLVPKGRPMMASSAMGQETLGRLVDVRPHENLCVLRSGQDWSETDGDEREFYLSKVKPYLDAGMDELSEDGLVRGCYFNRYMQLEDNAQNERTYSLSAWHSLAAVEAWVKADTHLAIWGAGIKHYKRVGDVARLRLYHELAVLKSQDQSFAYFNCHRGTGMLNAVAGGVSSPSP